MRRDGPHLFVSPHLDDAVFACGAWIASAAPATVVTVFAGSARPGAASAPWDGECGFHAGDDVVALRREEDRAALALLGAQPIWLDFRDDQYGESRGADAIAVALADAIDREAASAIHCPLGLFHSDHRRASDAALALFDRFASLDWNVYADAISRRIEGASDARVRDLAARGFALERASPRIAAGAGERKRAAVACYASQLRALRTRRSHDDVFAPETHWRLSRRGDGA
jgi:LmbE family N-acetylglucosaminyl deacetylase